MPKNRSTELATRLLETVLSGGVIHHLAAAISEQADEELVDSLIDFGRRLNGLEEKEALRLAQFALSRLVEHYARKAFDSITITSKEA